MLFRNSKKLTSKAVRLMMDQAIATAGNLGLAVTVSIVDAGGHLLMLERMSGGRFHTVQTSTAKAITAASNKRPTGSQGAQGQSLDLLHALGLALASRPGSWTAVEGGYPIIVENECIGAIGVSGGTEAQDMEIANAALAAVGASYEIQK